MMALEGRILVIHLFEWRSLRPGAPWFARIARPGRVLLSMCVLVGAR